MNLSISKKYKQFLQEHTLQKMKVQRLRAINQSSQYIANLCQKNGTTLSCCGYITCALVEYFSELEKFNGQSDIMNANQQNMTPYIEKVMKRLKQSRKIEIKKFWNQMSPTERTYYLKDWVANFQILDYLSEISQKMINKQVFFFRQCAHDNPEALKGVKYQQLQRTKQEIQFKGEKFFYTRFFPQIKNVKKDNFIEEIYKCDLSLPIIIATDVGGHFNVIILHGGVVYIVDSLDSLAINYDQYIVEFIQTCYKKVFE